MNRSQGHAQKGAFRSRRHVHTGVSLTMKGCGRKSEMGRGMLVAIFALHAPHIYIYVCPYIYICAYKPYVYIFYLLFIYVCMYIYKYLFIDEIENIIDISAAAYVSKRQMCFESCTDERVQQWGLAGFSCGRPHLTMFSEIFELRGSRHSLLG